MTYTINLISENVQEHVQIQLNGNDNIIVTMDQNIMYKVAKYSFDEETVIFAHNNDKKSGFFGQSACEFVDGWHLRDENEQDWKQVTISEAMQHIGNITLAIASSVENVSHDQFIPESTIKKLLDLSESDEIDEDDLIAAAQILYRMKAIHLEPTYYILNKNSHYLAVTGKIDTSSLKDCSLFSTLEELENEAAQVTDRAIDEVAGSAIKIRHDLASGWIETSINECDGYVDFGAANNEPETIESYISNYEM